MIKVESRHNRLVETGTAFLLLAYPGLMLGVKGGMNGAFLFLLLLSLSVWAYRPREMPPVVWDRDMVLYLMAMAALPIAIFLSQSYHHHYSGHPYDAASRFLLAVPVFLMLQRVQFRIVAMVQYSFPLAVLVGCLMLKQIDDGRYGISTIDLIHFGDFELILGVLSVLSINWTGRDTIWMRALKWVGFFGGVYASVVSGSRGGWIALPIFLIIFLYFKLGKISFRALIAAPLMLVMAVFLAYTFSQEIHHRVDNVSNDLAALQQGNPDTSIGVRLQLFKAAAEIFAEHPVFGVGPEGFANEMDPMQKAGKVTQMAAELGKGEVHNELLSKAASLGIFGIFASLAVYLVPGIIFYRTMRSNSVHFRQAGMLGLVFVSGFMVFGLTAETLNLTMATAFYSLTVAVLLAACLNIHRNDQFTVH